MATAISSYFSNVVYYGSSKARSAVSGIMAECLKAAKQYTPGTQQYHDAVKAKFSEGYNNAI